MKHYVSEFYKICGEPLELFYDTLNNESISVKDYPCLCHDGYNWNITMTNVHSYFVASDETGLGLQTKVGDKTFTTYYEDEEWCEILASGNDTDYYDSYYRSNIIRETITWNILQINRELANEGKVLLNEIIDIRLRTQDKMLAGIATQGIFMSYKNKVYLVLNKIITNNLDELEFSYVTVEQEDDSSKEIILVSDSSRKNIIGGTILLELDLDRRFSEVLALSTMDISSIADPDRDDFVDDNFEELDLTYEDVESLVINGTFHVTYQRDKALERFNKAYHMFDKKIDLVSYLLS